MSQYAHLRIGGSHWRAVLNPAPLLMDHMVAALPTDRATAPEDHPRGLTIYAHGRQVLLTAGEALDLLELLRRQEQVLHRMTDEDAEAIITLQRQEIHEARNAELKS